MLKEGLSKCVVSSRKCGWGCECQYRSGGEKLIQIHYDTLFVMLFAASNTAAA